MEWCTRHVQKRKQERVWWGSGAEKITHRTVGNIITVGKKEGTMPAGNTIVGEVKGGVELSTSGGIIIRLVGNGECNAAVKYGILSPGTMRKTESGECRRQNANVKNSFLHVK